MVQDTIICSEMNCYITLERGFRQFALWFILQTLILNELRITLFFFLESHVNLINK
jgi:hypothetical protein